MGWQGGSEVSGLVRLGIRLDVFSVESVSDSLPRKGGLHGSACVSPLLWAEAKNIMENNKEGMKSAPSS